jgi:hypothetical protein
MGCCGFCNERSAEHIEIFVLIMRESDSKSTGSLWRLSAILPRISLRIVPAECPKRGITSTELDPYIQVIGFVSRRLHKEALVSETDPFIHGRSPLVYPDGFRHPSAEMEKDYLPVIIKGTIDL